MADNLAGTKIKTAIRALLAQLIPNDFSGSERNSAKQTSISATVLSTLPCKNNGGCIDNPVLARRAMTLSDECSLKGWHAAARALAIESVILEPSSHIFFRQLGQLLISQGQPEYAKECLKGQMPDELLLQHLDALNDKDDFKQRLINGVASSAEFKRLHVSASETLETSKPISQTGDPLRVFGRKELQCTPTWVDRVLNGQCWHDTNHTLVLDRNGQTIKDHTVGSELLPRYVANERLPVYLGKRVCLLGSRGSGNYYHWMTDILPKLAICEQAGFELNSIDQFVIPLRRSSFQLISLAHLGIGPERVYFTSESPQWVTGE